MKPGILLTCVVLIISAAGCAQRTTSAPVVAAIKPNQPFQLSTTQAEAAEPAIAATPEGNALYVVWVEHRERDADLMLARLTSDGRPEGSPVRINPDLGEVKAWRGDPPTVAVATDGTIYVGWTARVKPPAHHATDLYLSASRDGGKTFSQPVKVNDDSLPAVHGMHSLAVSNNGRVYIAWLDERNITKPKPSAKAGGHHRESNREVFITSSSDGGRSFEPNRRIASDACPCCKTAIAGGLDNRVYVSWRQVLPGDFRHIAVASSSDAGQTFGKSVIVSDDQWMIAGCPVSGPTLSADKNGTVRVLWYSAGKNGQTGLYWSESDDGGSTFASRSLVAGGSTHGTPVLLETDNGVTAVWEGNELNVSRVLTSELKPGSKHIEVGSGELPAAVQLEDRLVIAYIAKENERQSIWITVNSNQ